MNNMNVSPYLPPLDVDNPDLPGDRTFTFSNVNFFESGSQEIKFSLMIMRLCLLTERKLLNQNHSEELLT